MTEQNKEKRPPTGLNLPTGFTIGEILKKIKPKLKCKVTGELLKRSKENKSEEDDRE